MTQSTQSISVTEASTRLSEIVAAMAPDDEIALTIDGKTVAKWFDCQLGRDTKADTVPAKERSPSLRKMYLRSPSLLRDFVLRF